MKTFLLLLGAAGMMGGQAVQAADTCPAPPAAGEKGGHNRFDPLVIDLNGDGVARTAPAMCGTATAAKEVKLVTYKGDVKVTASQNTQSLRQSVGLLEPATPPAAANDHAINTKGTGTSGRVAAPGPGGDCDDTDALSVSGASIPPPKAQLAIKCKGTSAR